MYLFSGEFMERNTRRTVGVYKWCQQRSRSCYRWTKGIIKLMH